MGSACLIYKQHEGRIVTAVLRYAAQSGFGYLQEAARPKCTSEKRRTAAAMERSGGRPDRGFSAPVLGRLGSAVQHQKVNHRRMPSLRRCVQWSPPALGPRANAAAPARGQHHAASHRQTERPRGARARSHQRARRQTCARSAGAARSTSRHRRRQAPVREQGRPRAPRAAAASAPRLCRRRAAPPRRAAAPARAPPRAPPRRAARSALWRRRAPPPPAIRVRFVWGGGRSASGLYGVGLKRVRGAPPGASPHGRAAARGSTSPGSRRTIPPQPSNSLAPAATLRRAPACAPPVHPGRRSAHRPRQLSPVPAGVPWMGAGRDGG